MDTDLFRALEWGHEVEVLYIYLHEPGNFCVDGAFEEDFGNHNIGRGCGHFAWVVYSVSA